MLHYRHPTAVRTGFGGVDTSLFSYVRDGRVTHPCCHRGLPPNPGLPTQKPEQAKFSTFTMIVSPTDLLASRKYLKFFICSILR